MLDIDDELFPPDEGDDEPATDSRDGLTLDILDVLADDRNCIKYRPRIATQLGSVTATILLQQVLYRWRARGRRAFYKFKEPCQHPAYKPGDSWTEELGFSRREFDSALARIGQKLSKGAQKDPAALVYYWTDISRMTHYEVNAAAVRNLAKTAYSS